MIDFNPILDIEPFEKVHTGHRVVFRSKDALAGPRGRRKRVIGRVRNLDPKAKTVQVGDWIVPLKKVERLSKDVFSDWRKAESRAHERQVYGGLSSEEKKWLRSCAKDARRAFLAPVQYSGPADRRFYARMKREREAFMRDLGFKDFTDKEQCESLPLFVARSLKAGITPKLESADYFSMDSGAVGVGDTVQIGGHRYKVASYDDEGFALLKDGRAVRFPMHLIPKDRYTRPIRRRRAALRRGGMKSRIKRARKRLSARRRARWNSKARWCYCFSRDRLGRFGSLKKGRNPARRWRLVGVFRMRPKRRWKPVRRARRDRLHRARTRFWRAA